MKRIKKIMLLSIIFLLFFVVKAYASNDQFIIDVETEYKSGDSGKMIVSFKSDKLIGAIKGKIISNNLKNVKANGSNGWAGNYYSGTGLFNFYKAEGSNEAVVGEFLFDIEDGVTDNFNISFENLIFTTPEPEYNNTLVVDLEKTIKIKKEEVKEVELSGISITKNPSKTEYVEGDFFDKTGLVITALYSDGSKKEVTDYSVLPTQALTLEDKSFVVSYKENNITKEVTGNIEVKKKEVNSSDDSGNNEENKKDDDKENGTDNETEKKDEGKDEKGENVVEDKKDENDLNKNDKGEGKVDDGKKDGTQVPSDMPITGNGKFVVTGIATLMVIVLVSYAFSKREG